MSTTLNGQAPITEKESSSSEHKPPFPGIPTTSDGAGMVVWVDTHITQGACAYPITSSTTMGGGFNAAVANGKKNLWGDDWRSSSRRASIGRHRLRRVRRRRRPRHQLHLGPGPGADEGGALHDLRQAPAGRHEHRRPGADAQGLNVHAGHDDVMASPTVAGACSSPATRRKPATSA